MGLAPFPMEEGEGVGKGEGKGWKRERVGGVGTNSKQADMFSYHCKDVHFSLTNLNTFP